MLILPQADWGMPHRYSMISELWRWKHSARLGRMRPKERFQVLGHQIKCESIRLRIGDDSIDERCLLFNSLHRSVEWILSGDVIILDGTSENSVRILRFVHSACEATLKNPLWDPGWRPSLHRWRQERLPSWTRFHFPSPVITQTIPFKKNKLAASVEVIFVPAAWFGWMIYIYGHILLFEGTTPSLCINHDHISSSPHLDLVSSRGSYINRWVGTSEILFKLTCCRLRLSKVNSMILDVITRLLPHQGHYPEAAWWNCCLLCLWKLHLYSILRRPILHCPPPIDPRKGKGTEPTSDFVRSSTILPRRSSQSSKATPRRLAWLPQTIPWCNLDLFLLEALQHRRYRLGLTLGHH